ncbi:MAG: hypothetical protein P1U63_04770 [Coxiellaceae bacterium]|nr:hypothetical protein [Coxiellaceae bacterium]
MLANDFKDRVAGGQRDFEPSAVITDIIAARGEGWHDGARCEMNNTDGRLNQLARVLSHDNTLPNTQIMAYLIVADHCFADSPPTLDLYKKKLGGQLFRNIDRRSLDYFVSVYDESLFSDKDRGRHFNLSLRGLLVEKVLLKLGINLSPEVKKVLNGLFACIQHAHHRNIKTTVPAIGKAYTATELREAIVKLRTYHNQIEDATEHYRKKGGAKSVKQSAILRCILQGSRWLLAQYIVLANTIGDKPSIRFTTDSMARLDYHLLEEWCYESSIAFALDALKPTPTLRTTGYGSAAAVAGLMAEPTTSAVDVTDVDVSLLTIAAAPYDESALLKTDDTPTECKPGT